ncbi:MAG TPA: hypothetical protein VGS22_09065 [Thermoanaerobaculia bacterium]|jgi:tetratricopeptide (TPR) repeat protein|nr:hypothetical protein [Thermoanaerobaculia bacterium]
MSRNFAGLAVWILPILLIVAMLAGPAIGHAAPKPISPAERAAVAMAVRAFERGGSPGVAWAAEVAPRSPLAKLPPGELSARLEAAVGPLSGSVWTLATPLGPALPAAPGGSVQEAIFHVEYPSGIDQILTLRLRPDAAGRWRLENLSTWADLATPGGSSLAARRPGPPGEAAAPGAAESDRAPRAPIIGLGVLVLALLGGGFLAWRRGTIPALLLAGVGSLLIAVGAFLAARALLDSGGVGDERPPPPVVVAATVPEAADITWSRVAKMHDVLSTSGDSAAALAFLHRQRPGSPEWVRIALDLAQADLGAGRLEAAEGMLREIAQVANAPLADVLRARIALERGDTLAASHLYGEASTDWVDCDALALERLEALLQMGDEENAQAVIERLSAGGSREAASHYYQARLFVARGDQESGLQSFRTAWKLAPIERRVVIGDPILVYLVRQGNLLGSMELAASSEPQPADAGPGSLPLVLPAGFTAAASGGELLISGAGAQLRIPGGGDLIPAGAIREDAVTRGQAREREVLAQLDLLARQLAAPAGAAQPALRRRLEIAVVGLARQNRWQALLDLTEPLAARPQSLPSSAVQLRAEALFRTRRAAEAAQLLVAFAKSGGAKNRQDPALYFRLGHLLLKLDQYDLAVRAIQKAEELSPFPQGDSEITRIRMDQNLAKAYRTLSTRHFLIRYPSDLNSPYFARLGEIFEEEYLRLGRWIPAALDRPVEINLYPFADFARVYSRGEFIGLYDGKVRLPFADVQTLQPEAITVMSHEIGHALLAAATTDFAPHWFQEGLAQHLQPVQGQINPLPDFEARGALLSLRLLDVPLSTPSDPELRSAAYDIAAWAVHFIEDRYGVQGIRRMIAAYREGLDTDQVLAKALHTDVGAFDRALLAWSKTPAGAAHSSDPVRYDLDEDKAPERFTIAN